MKNKLEIFRLHNPKHSKKRIPAAFSRLLSYNPRMFLVCFSFILRLNFASDRLEARPPCTFFVSASFFGGLADSFLAEPFSQVTKIIFKIFSLNFSFTIFNYCAHPPRQRDINAAVQTFSIGLCFFKLTHF